LRRPLGVSATIALATIMSVSVPARSKVDSTHRGRSFGRRQTNQTALRPSPARRWRSLGPERCTTQNLSGITTAIVMTPITQNALQIPPSTP
jgi:hypothetical protein